MKRKVGLQVAEIGALEATKTLGILLEKHGVDLSRDIELLVMLQSTDIEKLRSCLEKEV